MAGLIFSYATLAASIALLVFIPIAKHRRGKLTALKQLVPPGALLIFGSIFITSLGLLHGSHNSPLLIPASRFAPPVLAGDNYLPKVFADGVFAGHIPRPMHTDWLSSDRPPLQTGNSIWSYAWFSDDRDLTYVISSVILQSSFLLGLWSLLAAFGIPRKLFIIAITTVFFSGFTYVNGFYTWPKLYPVAFLLVFAAYLLTGHFDKTKNRPGTGAILGGLAALSMLGHGGSIFALLGIALSAVALRQRPTRSFLLTMAAVALVVYLPWMLYQRLYDPPGDRLIKWHIAGVVAPHPDVAITDLLVANYKRLTVRDIARLKLGNLKTVIGDLPQEGRTLRFMLASVSNGDAGGRDKAAASLRQAIFFYWIPCIGFAILCPFALLVARLCRCHQQPAFLGASRMWLCTGLTVFLWCILMYGPNYTVVHQGTYLTVILAFAGSSLAFWAIRPRLAIGLAGAQIAYNAVLFILLSPSSIAPAGVRVIDPIFPGFRGMAAACFLSACGFLAVLVHSGSIGDAVTSTISEEAATAPGSSRAYIGR